MSAPSSRHLSHDFPAYKGLSLRELGSLILLTTATFVVLFLLVGFLTGFVVALGCIGFLLGFIVAVTLMPTPIARLKAGKPHGHLKKNMRIHFAAWGLMKSPYLSHRGLWQTTRRIRRNHV